MWKDHGKLCVLCGRRACQFKYGMPGGVGVACTEFMADRTRARTIHDGS